MQKTIYALTVLICTLCLQACGPMYKPSQMNVEKPQLNNTSAVEQIALQDLNDTTLSILADQYGRAGEGPLSVSMTFDPASKTYTAMRARLDVQNIEKTLRQKGVRNINASTIPLAGEEPSLLIMYDRLALSDPAGCDFMPGIASNRTVRAEMKDYSFGCTTEMMLVRQISRPGDLQGRGGDVMGVNDGRRITNVMETYHTLNERQASGELDRDLALERDGLQSD